MLTHRFPDSMKFRGHYETNTVNPTSYVVGQPFTFFFLRSAHRCFIAIESRLLPSGIGPPRFFLMVVVPLGLPTRFLPLLPDRADPNNAVIALSSLSLSFFKSATNLSRSNVYFFSAPGFA